MRRRKNTVLVLRTTNADGVSRNGFKWPTEGYVEAPDWDPEPECGKGLHGALWGEGDGSLFLWSPSARWQVVEVLKKDVVSLGRKVKFRAGKVLYSGGRKTATDMIYKYRPGAAVIGGHATAGRIGTATAGDRGTAIAGHGGTAKTERYGTATAGDGGTATAGDGGTATAGDGGTATAGFYGTATAGDEGTATAGYEGTATVGRYGTSTAGDRGTAMAGYEGTATAGDNGVIVITDYHDSRRRLVVGYVGEDGILPNTPYRAEEGKLVAVGAKK